MKVFLAVLLLLLVGGGYVGYKRLGPEGSAYRAYQESATAELRGGQTAAKLALARFGLADQIGDVVDISYERESSEWEGDDRVRIVALQYVTHVYRDGFGNPSGRPRVLKRRQRALVERVGEDWKLRDLESEELD